MDNNDPPTFSWSECFAFGGDASPKDANFKLIDNWVIKNSEGEDTLLFKGLAAKVYDDYYFFDYKLMKKALKTLNMCLSFLEHSKATFEMAIPVSTEESKVVFFSGGMTGVMTVVTDEQGLRYVQQIIDNKTRSYRVKGLRDPNQSLRIP